MLKRVDLATMERPSNMSESWSHQIVQTNGGANRCRGVCDTFAPLFALLALMRTCQAQTDERFAIPVDRQKSDFNGLYERAPLAPPPFALPPSYQLMGMPETKTFPTEDFRRRRPSVFEEKDRTDGSDDAPMLRGTTVWQRLRDFRSHGRLRLLTLWEAGGSSVSLQAGKKGEPSLQWASRGMNRGGTTRGVFDQLFSISLAHASHGMHFAPSAGGAEPVGKSAKLLDGPNK